MKNQFTRRLEKCFNRGLGCITCNKMNRLFSGCETFNEPLNNWNVTNVKNMEGMFYNCKNFNQDLGYWNVSGVIANEGMKEMFLVVKVLIYH